MARRDYAALGVGRAEQRNSITKTRKQEGLFFRVFVFRAFVIRFFVPSRPYPISCFTGFPSGTNSIGRPSWDLYQVCSGTPSAV
jgi:hypothetical protein